MKTKVASIAKSVHLSMATPILTSPVLLLLLMPDAAQAQFTYTTNNGTITITGYTGPGGAVIVPSAINGLPVTSIGVAAFLYSLNIRDLTIPTSVTTVGVYAFDHCTGLTSISMPNSVTNIGNFAFVSCTSLTNVTIPNKINSIGSGTFYSCASLTSTTIPSNITTIGDNAFVDCTSLNRTTIGKSVTNIGNKAFFGCSSMDSVYFEGNAPSPGVNMFAGVSNATVYYLPGTTGWGPTFGGLPTALWQPVVETGDTSFGPGTNGFGFTTSWASSMIVVVEATTTLANPNWIPLATNTLTGGSDYFSDPQWVNYTGRFYRIRSP
jgi:hypothetical protein